VPGIHEVARDFTAMLRAGRFVAAGERFWAANVISIEPSGPFGTIPNVSSGKVAATAKSRAWFAASRIDDLSIDGPFVTGNQFALFLDMAIVDRASGAATPFTEIALYTVREGQIAEERYFYG
jgi:SnoaL-like domain